MMVIENRFHLNARVQGQSPDLKRASGGKRLGKMLAIHSVDRREIIDVRQKNGGFYGI